MLTFWKIVKQILECYKKHKKRNFKQFGGDRFWGYRISKSETVLPYLRWNELFHNGTALRFPAMSRQGPPNIQDLMGRSAPTELPAVVSDRYSLERESRSLAEHTD